MDNNRGNEVNDIEWQTPHPAVTEMYRTAIGEHLARLNELDESPAGTPEKAGVAP
jgi:hypothetical protein